MNTKLVSSIDAVTRSRLVTIDADALLMDAAKLLSDTQISLLVVCKYDGAMMGVITKTNIVQQIGRCGESACTTAAADVMTRDVTYCRPTDYPVQFPVAARAGFRNVRSDPDLISAKLPALHFYQLAIPAPKPPKGSFDRHAARRGKTLFKTKRCVTCHVPPTYTEPGWNMHTPLEIGVDDFQANRSPDKRYRTAPLKGLWSHTTGGFYHDGRFATLRDVVNHYDAHFGLLLSDPAKDDLIEFLKSL